MRGLKGTKVHTVENYINPIGEELRSKAPVVAVSPQPVARSRLYRVIAATDINFYLSKEASPAAATTGDILLPAKVAAVIDTGIYDKFVFVGLGPVQLVELGE